MDKEYIRLFSLMTLRVSNIAEQVMDLHKDNKEGKEYHAAETMRDEFLNLHTKIDNNEVLTKADYARLLVGSFIVANQINSTIEANQKALQGYKVDIIPKLDQVNNIEDKEEAVKLAEELFKVKEEEEKP